MSAEETTSKHNKLHKRVKLAIGRSKNSKGNVETLNSKKSGARGIQRSHSRTVKADDVPYVDDKLSKRDNGCVKNSMKSKTVNKLSHGSKEEYGVVVRGNRGVEAVNSDWKRKRIYAGPDKNVERTFQKNVRTLNRKEFSKAAHHNHQDDFVKDNRSTKGAPLDFEKSSKRKFIIGRKKVTDNVSLDKKGSTSFRAKTKPVHRGKDSELDGDGNGMLKKGAKSRIDFNKQLGWNQNKYVAESLGKSARTKFQDKKSLLDDSAATDDRPKKKKRVIRIDPHDFTNKRLDDGIATSDCSREKKEELEENKEIEMSKNAQFRAIQPSPSILSFVEENLLGRRREIELRRTGYNTELSVPLDNIPFSTSSERERIEETVFRNKLTFFAAAKISSSIPPPDLPEIAFAGRSNVGKSSLLNALTRQWGVVRTSDKPGLTQTINFFKLEPKLCLVDLPGYGFAYAKEEVKEAWEEFVKDYVSTRVGLKRVCLLIDTKWGMKPRDHELINLMERSQTKYQIVLTKTDLVFPIDVARRAMQIEESLKAKKSAVQPVIMVSSKSGAGIRSLRTALAKIARFAKL